MADSYFIRDGYRHRPDPEYATDVDTDGVTWQPDVYPEAARVAERLGASCIVDVGCGGGTKLIALHPRFEVVGIDLPGPNIEACRARLPAGRWVEHDLESELPLPVPDDVLARSVIVSSDVIEHLRRPERLLAKLRSALGVSPAVVLSTPDRERTWGRGHDGPPPNPCHVREWTTDELDALLEHSGFHHRSITLTRSNDRLNEDKTVLCLLFADARVQRAATDVDGATV